MKLLELIDEKSRSLEREAEQNRHHLPNTRQSAERSAHAEVMGQGVPDKGR
ncbi:MAG: hypothetical protein OEY77_01055 [Nitrospira sp.]|nr:hypothetical protein [Nitrospira sp.]